MDIQTRYDTNDVPLKERFAYWQEAVCSTYVQLGCEANSRSNFNGLIDISRHSTLSISRVKGKSHTVKRRDRDIRRATDSYFLLSLQTENCSRVSQFGQTTLLNPGDMAIYSSSDPYTLELSDDFSQTVVQLPKDQLLARLPNAEMMAGRKINGQSGIGRLVGENILAFSNYADTANPVLESLVQDTLIDLIATGLASQDCCNVVLSSPEQHVMLRVKSYVHSNLGNPRLDRQNIADEMGMSVRRLNAIFAKEDSSLSTLIRQTRLTAIANELKDIRFANQSISEVAAKYGFENFQHFSKSFRTHFGYSPREYRSLK